MPMKQENRLLGLETPLGKDVLELTAFSGVEEMSRLFSFHLEMISDNSGISASQIVGKQVTFSVTLPDGSPRHFNGWVIRFVAGDEDRRGRRNYRAEVVPWLWFLTRSTDCRIFQNKDVKAIVEAVFKKFGFTNHDFKLRGSYPQREYCVQYRETAFQFVSRLLEDEGIFYFFRHENGKHTMVLADQTNAYTPCREKEVAYHPGRLRAGHVNSWEHQYEFRSGKSSSTDYNFETPSTSLAAATDTLSKLPGVDKFELFDYPGLHAKKDDGAARAKVRMGEEETPGDVVVGAGTCCTFTPGGTFKLSRHECSSEEGSSYVLTAVEHQARDVSYTNTTETSEYDNTFTCIPDRSLFRPARVTPRPVVQGPQTAIVVGPSGEEIYTVND
jgi:type VI secretion system secreted protein VgrG